MVAVINMQLAGAHYSCWCRGKVMQRHGRASYSHMEENTIAIAFVKQQYTKTVIIIIIDHSRSHPDHTPDKKITDMNRHKQTS